MTTTGMSSEDIDEIVARRQDGEMRKRRSRVTVIIVVLVMLAFALVPALSDPMRAIRMQQRGTETQALVTNSDNGPVTCDGSGCTQQVHVVFSTSGATVPDSVLTADFSALWNDGADYALAAVDHAIPSAAATSNQGDRFPVWFIADGQDFPRELTAKRPPNPLTSAVTTWWWLLVPLLILVLYPRIDAVVIRRRGTA
jgi:hypothetical protein